MSTEQDKSTGDSTIGGRWSKLDSMRTAHLNRARYCSELTIPSLLPKEGTDENTPLPTPFQSLGARCSNNLAAKLLLTLFPPNTPSHRLDVPPALIAELKEKMGEDDFRTKIEEKLATIERTITSKFESDGARVEAFRILRLLLVTGDVLVEYPKEGSMTYYRLDKYVVRRNPAGKPVEIILKEEILKEEIPEVVKAQVTTDVKEKAALYTQYKLDGNTWTMTQEICGVTVPGVGGTYPKDQCPVIPLPWTLADGENYGRGHVEEYLGDFISLESLTQSIVEGSAAAARILFLIDPNGTTNAEDLKKTPNGGCAVGRKDDVTTLQLDKYADFKIAYEAINKIESRLSAAFLLRDSVQRQAERVTAQEIRYMAQELEDSLGGIYSVLSQSFQKPTILMYKRRMEKTGEIVKLPNDVTVTITTGFEALGRGHDLNKIRGLMEDIAPFKEAALHEFNLSDLITRLCTAHGIDKAGLVLTEEEKATKKQETELMQMLQSLGPNAVNALGQLLKQKMAGDQAQGESPAMPAIPGMTPQ